PTGDDYVGSLLLDDRPLPTQEELETLMRSRDPKANEEFIAIMRGLLMEDLIIPEAPESFLAGIPADLLRRRPDVRAAEQRIVAQNARVGVAIADLYPMFTLSGSFGLEANSFSDMFDSDSIVAGVGPAFRWNILNFGKYRFNIEAQRFMQEELVATYRQTVLKAAEDVDNALVRYANESERTEKLADAIDEYLEVLHLAFDLQGGGTGHIDAILEASAGLISNGLMYVQSQASQTGSVVQLYRALGGDWDAAPAEPVEAVAPVASDYDPKEDWERRQAESEARLADARAAARENREDVVVENADFDIVADDELEASPELAEPVVATVDASYADEALIVE
ncbi:MAG: TolC family protein, partial [Thermoguttaceae bacterium]|nr:TolC family protein [Thermoguttaceae bacterium]